jgi:hypothetical protein
MRVGPRAGAAVLLLLAGAATGLSVLALHHRTWALVTGLVATALALVALPPGWWSRLPFGLGWALMVGLATAGRPEGDYLLARSLRGYVVLGAALVVLGAAVATLPRRRLTPPGEGRRESGDVARPA